MGLVGWLLGDTEHVVAGVYIGDRTPRSRVEWTNPEGRRGVFVQPEVGLPDGYEPPSAALVPPQIPPGASGMFVDPAQIPTTLMEPSMQAGQSTAPETPAGEIMAKPAVGSVVHLLTLGSHDCQAAIVTRVAEDGTTVALAVFAPPAAATVVPEEAPVLAYGEVAYDPAPAAAPTWHWPEEVG